ncbi:MAG: hypothetical protein ABIA93_02810 [Candidatus Woesearchaeota archaeon]
MIVKIVIMLLVLAIIIAGVIYKVVKGANNATSCQSKGGTCVPTQECKGFNYGLLCEQNGYVCCGTT